MNPAQPVHARQAWGQNGLAARALGVIASRWMSDEVYG